MFEVIFSFFILIIIIGPKPKKKDVIGITLRSSKSHKWSFGL